MASLASAAFAFDLRSARRGHRLLPLSDETLKEYGIKPIGHRRLLRRYLKEDEQLQAEAEALREEAAKRKAVERNMRRLGGFSGDKEEDESAGSSAKAAAAEVRRNRS